MPRQAHKDVSFMLQSCLILQSLNITIMHIYLFISKQLCTSAKMNVKKCCVFPVLPTRVLTVINRNLQRIKG